MVAYIAGGASFWIRDFENADRYTGQATELEREAAFPQWIRSLQLSLLGRHDEAIAAAERAAIVGQRQPCCCRVSAPPTAAPAVCQTRKRSSTS